MNAADQANSPSAPRGNSTPLASCLPVQAPSRAIARQLAAGLRADYLVARAGRRYIAEVKTGRLAPRLAHGPTRRQLLEYRAAFDVHGVILVDADLQTITHVEVDLFAERSQRRPRRGAGTLALVAVVLFSMGVVVGTTFAR